VLLSPGGRSALILVTEAMLATPYRVRYELIEFAVCTLAARAQGLVALHGAGLALGTRGVLLAGPSGAGKSTLTLQAALAGFDVVSEDSIYVAPRSLRATGVANFLHLRTDAPAGLSAAQARRIVASPLITRRSGVRKFEVDLRTSKLGLARKPVRLVAVALLSPARAKDGRLLRRVSGAKALAELERGQPYAAGQRGWAQFRERIAMLDVFELRRGASPGDAVTALREACE